MTYTDKEKKERKKDLDTLSALLIKLKKPMSSSLKADIRKDYQRTCK